MICPKGGRENRSISGREKPKKFFRRKYLHRLQSICKTEMFAQKDTTPRNRKKLRAQEKECESNASLFPRTDNKEKGEQQKHNRN